jgi:hypothetical protein
MIYKLMEQLVLNQEEGQQKREAGTPRNPCLVRTLKDNPIIKKVIN